MVMRKMVMFLIKARIFNEIFKRDGVPKVKKEKKSFSLKWDIAADSYTVQGCFA